MAAQASDPAHWFSSLLEAQNAFWRDSGTAVTGSHPWPWLPAMQWSVEWPGHVMDQFAAWWKSAAPGWYPAHDPGQTRDRRFAGDPWIKDPRFEALARIYLARADAVRNALESAPLDDRIKAQWGFVLRHVVDALSPANVLATNPEAVQTAIESGGMSLVEGMRLFMEDFAKGKVSMTDDTAFEVGRNVATTPGSVVFENELMQLIQYAPTTANVHKRPLLMVPPCINKFYILDLQPDNSFVGHAVAHGHTVFLVSWRNVGPDQGRSTWDDYLQEGVMRAIDVALDVSAADRVNTLGFCLGGTLLASALAVMAARGVDKVESMSLLTTMLDFTDTGDLGLLVTEPSVALREMTLGNGGVVRGRELAQVFAALRANDLIWPYVVNGYLKGKAPPAFDLLFWNSDDSNLPGPMYCWYLRNTYLENKLAEPGATVQCGQPVDLGDIAVPAFLYASREDHIVPWRTAYASTHLLGGDTRFVLGASGHIAGVINAPAKNKRSYWTSPEDADAPPDPDAWLESAVERPGSWWTVWADWLAGHAGPEVAAPQRPGNASYSVIEPAPGRYVKAKAS